MLNDEIVASLSELVAEHPGKTKLSFMLRDSSKKHQVLLHSATKHVDVRRSLLDYIESQEGMEYNIN